MFKDDFRFHDVLGDEYDLSVMAYPHHDEFQKAIGEVIRRKFRDSELEEIKVLEIGCGTGITSRILLECDPRTRIVSIDNEPKMILQVKANVASRKTENRMAVVQADAMEIWRGCRTNRLTSSPQVSLFTTSRKMSEENSFKKFSGY